MLDYLRKKYGYVYQVKTFQNLQPKGAIEKAGKALGMKIADVRLITKKVVTSIDDVPVTKANKEVLMLAKQFEDITDHHSIHASAVLVFPKEPTEFCAIERAKSDDNSIDYVAAYDYHELEELGLAKIDVLGLKNMDIIEDTMQLLAKRNIKFDINNIPLNDAKVTALLDKVDVAGVFQIESALYQGLISQIKPKVFDDVYPLVALGRPSVLALGLDKEYIKVRKERLSE